MSVEVVGRWLRLVVLAFWAASQLAVLGVVPVVVWRLGYPNLALVVLASWSSSRLWIVVRELPAWRSGEPVGGGSGRNT